MSSLVIDLTGLTAKQGFIIQGDEAGDQAGYSVASAGDINGDGFADLIVGAPRGDNGGGEAGEAYVIFGKAGATRANIDLTSLAASDGFIIQGDVLGDYAGFSVSSAGDINGDGFADLIVGAHFGDNGGTQAGEAYVIFGKAGATRTNIDLTSLAASDGFIIQGDVAGDKAGSSVSSAGDINGDGFADLIVGARYGDNGGTNTGEAYVIFGKAGVARANIDLTSLAASDGFIIQGDIGFDYAGWSVSSAGDINGDGFADLIVGAPSGDNGGTNAGEAYVIFGKAGATRANIDLTGLAGSDGFIIQGDTSGDNAGFSVSSAGDINKDGFADLIVGARNGDNGGLNAGEAYVIYGSASFGSAPVAVDDSLKAVKDQIATYATFQLLRNDASLFPLTVSAVSNATGGTVVLNANKTISFTPTAGFTGAAGFDYIATDGSLGDTGRVTITVAAPEAAKTIDLAGLTASQGFIIQGDDPYDFAGSSVSSAGDINGDGFADFIISAPNGDNGGYSAGEAYVIFGKAGATRANIDLTSLAASDGFIIQGDVGGDLAGRSVSSAGDINGDGFADLIVGAPYGDNGGNQAGEAYVIFGKAGATRTTVDLTNLAASNGFIIQGDVAGDFAGRSVAAAGDINGDGFADLIVGAFGGDNGGYNAGEAYVIFGKAGATRANIDLTSFAANDGFIIQGDDPFDFAGISVSSAGDINGDGFADLIVGAPGGDNGGAEAGEAYVIYGSANIGGAQAVNQAPTAAPVTLTAIAEDSGARLITAAELLAGTADVDGPARSITAFSLTSGNGTLVSNGDATWSYTPAADDDTAAAFAYTVSDGSLSASSTASLDITPVNDAPTAAPVTLNAIAEDSGARIITAAELLAGTADVDGPSRSITAFSLTSGNGTLVDNGDATWSYTPAADDDTAAAFAYTVSDGSLSASSTASLDITPVNDAPTASPVTLTAIAEDSGARLITAAELLAGTADVDGPARSITAFSLTSGNGTLVANGDATWSYTPAADDDTAAAFAYTVSDGSLSASSTASLDITPVNDAPTAAPVTLTAIAEDSGARLITAAELLAGTADIDGPARSITAFSLTSGNGTLVANGDATWSYTPAADDDTAAAFAYTVSDGSLSASSTASLDISPVNDAPVISLGAGDSAAVVLEEPTSSTGVSASDTLTVTDIDLADVVASSVTGVTLGGTTGGLTAGNVLSLMSVAPASGLAANSGASNNLAWTFNSGSQTFDFLNDGQSLTLTYTITASDGQGGSDTQDITVTINGHRELYNGTPLDDQIDGSFADDEIYSNDGDDIIDGKGGDDIIDGGARDDVIRGGSGNDLLIGGSGNDQIDGGSDADTIVLPGTWNDYNITNIGSSYFVQERIDLDGNSQLDTDTLINVETIRFGGIGGTDVVTEVAVDNAPVAANDTGTTTGDVLANDTDADIAPLGDSLTVSAARSGTEAAPGALTAFAGSTLIAGTYGSLTLQSGGGYAYAANTASAAYKALGAGASVSDTFTYRVTDEKGLADTAQLTITVTGVNDAPVATAIAAQTATEGAAFSFNPSASFSDPDTGDQLTYSLGVGTPTWLSINPTTGQVTGTPGSGDVGAASVAVVATDSGGLFASQSFSLTTTATSTPQFYTGTNTFDSFVAPNNGNWTVDAREGNDIITTQGGNDTFIAGKGNDTYISNGGNDLFTFSGGTALNGFDSINGGSGFDEVRALTNNTVIGLTSISNVELITANGKTGVSVQGSVLADNLDFTGSTLVGITSIKGGAGADTILGSNGNDTIEGGTGNDTLAGGGGNDLFLFKTGDGFDSFVGGDGIDTVQATAASAKISGLAMSGIEFIDANGFANVSIVGDTTANVINLTGVTILGTGVTIDGAAGNDTITGSDSSDIIKAGSGKDVLKGGLGNDVFDFDATTDSGFGATKADTIIDFTQGFDKIDLSTIDASVPAAGNNPFAFIGNAAFGRVAGELRYDTAAIAGTTVIYGDINGDAKADFEIRLTGTIALNSGDFVF